MRKLSIDLNSTLLAPEWGVRSVRGIDTRRLRLFFLSLLWRAAASSLPEFSEVQVSSEDLETLRLMLLQNDPNPLSFYPIQLTQLSTFGIIHNHTPLKQTKIIPAIDGEFERSVNIFRFYFDGLIVHFHCQPDSDGIAVSRVSVGAHDELLVTTVTYEQSFQRENLELIMSETYGA